jgi:hypothetical protein
MTHRYNAHPTDRPGKGRHKPRPPQASAGDRQRMALRRRDHRETTTPTGQDTPRLAQESGRTTIAAGIGTCRNPAQEPEGPATTRRGWDSPHVARIGTDGDPRRDRACPTPRGDLDRTEQSAAGGLPGPSTHAQIGTDRTTRRGWAWRTQRRDHDGRRPPAGWRPPCPLPLGVVLHGSAGGRELAGSSDRTGRSRTCGRGFSVSRVRLPIPDRKPCSERVNRLSGHVATGTLGSPPPTSGGHRCACSVICGAPRHVA